MVYLVRITDGSIPLKITVDESLCTELSFSIKRDNLICSDLILRRISIAAEKKEEKLVGWLHHRMGSDVNKMFSTWKSWEISFIIILQSTGYMALPINLS